MKQLCIALAAALFLTIAGCGDSSSRFISPPVTNPVSVTIAQAPNHLGASETHTFSATVTNATDSTVTWSVSGCSICGSISESGLYTAPGFVQTQSTITITATSRADATKSATVTLSLMPVSIGVTPDNQVDVLLGETQKFIASLDHDPQKAGATWSITGSGCSGAACGTLTQVTTTSAVYHAPETVPNPPKVNVIAKSVTDPAQSAQAEVTVSGTVLQLSGKYGLFVSGYRDGILSMIAGQFTIDRTGHFTGVWDANRGSTAEVQKAISGTYSILADGLGTMTINDGSVTATYNISINPAATFASLAESTVPAGAAEGGSSGYIVKQDESAFTLAAIQGERVIAMHGEATYSHVAALGRFTSDTAGTVSGAAMDLSWEIDQNVAHFANTVNLTGAFTAPASGTGRGTAALTVAKGSAATYNFAYYIVSADRLLLVQTDERGFNNGLLIPTLGGEVVRQRKSGLFADTSLHSPMIFHVTDAAGGGGFIEPPVPRVSVGRIVPQGTATLELTLDENSGGTILSNSSTTAAYSVSANGRVTSSKGDILAYLIDDNTGYLATADGDGAGFGAFEPQTDVPAIPLRGKYRLSTRHPAMSGVENDVGVLEVLDNGAVNASIYINTGSGASLSTYTGTATIRDDGRGTIALNSTPGTQVVFWAPSSRHAYAVMSVTQGDLNPVLLELQR